MKFLISRINNIFVELILKKFNKKLQYSFYLNSNEYISSQIYSYGLHEKELLDYIFSLLETDEKSECIDIGSNIGNHSLYFSKYFTKIYSFEPTPITYSVLNVNIALNNLDHKIETFNCALSNINCDKKFVQVNSNDIGRSHLLSDSNQKNNNDTIFNVNCKTGDSIFQSNNNISLIKIDTEGHEAEIIIGLKNTILLNKPLILFELNYFTNNSFNAVEELKKLNYRYFYIPKMKFYSINNRAIRFLLRVFFGSKFKLINMESNTNLAAQICIASHYKM